MIGIVRQPFLAAALIVAATSSAVAADGYLGVYLTEGTQSDDGALVEEVAPGSPAAEAGLRKGDRIVAANGEATPHSQALIRVLTQARAGQELALRVSRDGWEKELQVTLGRRGQEPGPEASPQAQPPKKERGFLGVYLREGPEGQPVVDGVQRGSAAAEAGLRPGDLVQAVGERKVQDPSAMIEALGGYGPGERVELTIQRAGQTAKVPVTLGRREAATEAPEPRAEPQQPEAPPSPSAKEPAYVGVALDDAGGAGPLKVVDVQANSPAERFGVRKDDVIVAVGDTKVSTIEGFVKAMEPLYAGDVAVLTIERDGWKSELRITLGRRPGQ